MDLHAHERNTSRKGTEVRMNRASRLRRSNVRIPTESRGFVAVESARLAPRDPASEVARNRRQDAAPGRFHDEHDQGGGAPPSAARGAQARAGAIDDMGPPLRPVRARRRARLPPLLTALTQLTRANTLVHRSEVDARGSRGLSPGNGSPRHGSPRYESPRHGARSRTLPRDLLGLALGLAGHSGVDLEDGRARSERSGRPWRGEPRIKGDLELSDMNLSAGKVHFDLDATTRGIVRGRRRARGAGADAAPAPGVAPGAEAVSSYRSYFVRSPTPEFLKLDSPFFDDVKREKRERREREKAEHNAARRARFEDGAGRRRQPRHGRRSAEVRTRGSSGDGRARGHGRGDYNNDYGFDDREFNDGDHSNDDYDYDHYNNYAGHRAHGPLLTLDEDPRGFIGDGFDDGYVDGDGVHYRAHDGYALHGDGDGDGGDGDGDGDGDGVDNNGRGSADRPRVGFGDGRGDSDDSSLLDLSDDDGGGDARAAAERQQVAPRMRRSVTIDESVGSDHAAHPEAAGGPRESDWRPPRVATGGRRESTAAGSDAGARSSEDRDSAEIFDNDVDDDDDPHRGGHGTRQHPFPGERGAIVVPAVGAPWADGDVDLDLDVGARPGSYGGGSRHDDDRGAIDRDAASSTDDGAPRSLFSDQEGFDILYISKDLMDNGSETNSEGSRASRQSFVNLP